MWGETGRGQLQSSAQRARFRQLDSAASLDARRVLDCALAAADAVLAAQPSSPWPSPAPRSLAEPQSCSRPASPPSQQQRAADRRRIQRLRTLSPSWTTRSTSGASPRAFARVQGDACAAGELCTARGALAEQAARIRELELSLELERARADANAREAERLRQWLEPAACADDRSQVEAELADCQALLCTLEDIVKVHFLLHPGRARTLRLLLSRRAPAWLERVEAALPPEVLAAAQS
eukprot:TRINITY_DN44126_c0_g1_i1.p1 TRINITY_DN44126_c0_g1~~TRINITY_DN44126_c0_g1_i1.p1  ORF type:complete len:259 (+),score=46.59 TRINITY_DN44126_c0_g1_i1:66-779(+)